MTKRVMLAEDEPNIIESLSFLLERSGFEISVHTSGSEALGAALANPPDLLVLDVMLPEMDGFEILRRLRADERGNSLPVIMLTAKGQREDREAAREAGADVFITKPFSNADVINAVKSLTGGQTV